MKSDLLILVEVIVNFLGVVRFAGGGELFHLRHRRAEGGLRGGAIGTLGRKVSTP